jgi:hypothetical protein
VAARVLPGGVRPLHDRALLRGVRRRPVAHTSVGPAPGWVAATCLRGGRSGRVVPNRRVTLLRGRYRLNRLSTGKARKPVTRYHETCPTIPAPPSEDTAVEWPLEGRRVTVPPRCAEGSVCSVAKVDGRGGPEVGAASASGTFKARRKGSLPILPDPHNPGTTGGRADSALGAEPNSGGNLEGGPWTKGPAASLGALAPIHRSAWKEGSRNFAVRKPSEVRGQRSFGFRDPPRLRGGRVRVRGRAGKATHPREGR